MSSRVTKIMRTQRQNIGKHRFDLFSSWKTESFMDVNPGNEYLFLITSNPMKVKAAWLALSRDTFLLNIASYPRILHESMINTMKANESSMNLRATVDEGK